MLSRRWNGFGLADGVKQVARAAISLNVLSNVFLVIRAHAQLEEVALGLTQWL